MLCNAHAQKLNSGTVSSAHSPIGLLDELPMGVYDNGMSVTTPCHDHNAGKGERSCARAVKNLTWFEGMAHMSSGTYSEADSESIRSSSSTSTADLPTVLSRKKTVKKFQAPRFDDVEAETAIAIESSLPSGICDLANLELVVVPPKIDTCLRTITVLYLSDNRLKEIPESLFADDCCQSLVTLNVSNNNLVSLPVDLFRLPNLEVLLADHNAIVDLPIKEVGSALLPSLRRAGFEWNQLQRFPMEFFEHCMWLTELMLGQNEHMLDRPISMSSLFYSRSAAAIRSSRTPSFADNSNDSVQSNELSPNRCRSANGTDEISASKLKNSKLSVGHVNDLASNQPNGNHNGQYASPIPINPVFLKLDNRPSLLEQIQREKWPTRLPWLNIEFHKIYPDRVLGFLYLGSLRTAQTTSVYRDLNIGFVLTVGRDLDVKVMDGMEHLVITVDDLPGEDLTSVFPEAFAFIDKARKAEKGILVHCFAGMSRSVTVAAAYMMTRFRPMTRDDALAIIKRARPAAQPNEGFMESLLRYEARLRGEKKK